jgi:hypothetical protein
MCAFGALLGVLRQAQDDTVGMQSTTVGPWPGVLSVFIEPLRMASINYLVDSGGRLTYALKELVSLSLSRRDRR